MFNDPFAFLWMDGMPKQERTPLDYGLNHTEWRPGQQQMLDWVLQHMESGSSAVGVVEASTGTGKTTLPRALSHQYKTISLVRTKVLQQENYEKGYDFRPLYGRSSYPCIHEDAPAGMKADKCLFAEKGMVNCDYHHSCPYVNARDAAKQAKRSVLNYAYWFHAYFKWPKPDVLVCDEGHQLSDEVLNWAGTTVSEETRQKWGLPLFPIIRGGQGSMLIDAPNATDRAHSWLNDSLHKVVSLYEALSEDAEYDGKARDKARELELFGNKLKATLEALTRMPEDWYIKSGPGVHGNKAAFVARPLTAKHHFKRYFTNSDWKLFIMSATIGNVDVFAEELGLDNYIHHCVPSMYKAEQRPVLALDTPSMGAKCSDKDKEKQADEIAKAIKECSPEWAGIIHVNAIKEAPELAKRLAKRGLEDRVWVGPSNLGTNQSVLAWHNQCRRNPGSINITWSMWEGYDPAPDLNIKMSIVAKVAFPYLGDDYEVVRSNYNRQMYYQRAAWKVEQGCGRSRRGRIADYDTSTEKHGLVAIADSSYRMIKKYFSKDFQESIVKAG